MLDPTYAFTVRPDTHLCAAMLKPSLCILTPPATADCNTCGLLRVYRYDNRIDIVHPDKLEALLSTTIPVYPKQTTRNGLAAGTMALPALTASSTA